MLADGAYGTPYQVGRASVIRSLLPQAPVGGRALDLGCGPGFYSQLLAEKGWEVTAVDADHASVDRAMRFAHRGIVGDAVLALDELSGSCFGLVLILELVEHLLDGELMLRKLHGVTAPAGHVIISTPNRLSPEGLHGYYWGEKLRGWGRWNAWDPSHVKIYTSFEFFRVLRKTGWAVDKVVGYWYKGPLPLGLRWCLPLTSSSCFPIKRFGFNLIVLCHPEGRGGRSPQGDTHCGSEPGAEGRGGSRGHL